MKTLRLARSIVGPRMEERCTGFIYPHSIRCSSVQEVGMQEKKDLCADAGLVKLTKLFPRMWVENLGGVSRRRPELGAFSKQDSNADDIRLLELWNRVKAIYSGGVVTLPRIVGGSPVVNDINAWPGFSPARTDTYRYGKNIN